MDTVRRTLAQTVLGLARFLDTWFYHIAVALTVIFVLNYIFVKDWDKILLNSAKDGNVDEVKRALENEADVNVQNVDDCTPLIIACAFKRDEVVKILLETKNCQIELTNAKGKTALLVASESGNVEIVKMLLRYKANVKNCDNDGNIPLIAAVAAGHVEVVKCLLAFNSEVKWKNKLGVNSLNAAINSHHLPEGRLAVINLLLQFKCNIESKSGSGWTALIKASYKGYTDVVKLLLQYKANINARGHRGFTALIAASQNGWKEVVQVLLENGADSSLALDDGSNALVAASFGGYPEIVELLAGHNKQTLQCRYKNGSTPLMAAVVSGYVDVVKVLLSHHQNRIGEDEEGLDVNSVNKEYWSALTVAADKGCYSITKLLLGCGKKQKRSKQHSLLLNEKEVEISNNMSTGQPQNSSESDNEGNDVTFNDTDSRKNKISSPTTNTDDSKDVVEVDYLEKVAPVEIDPCTSTGFTPLMYAIKKGFIDIVSELLEAGAVVNHFEIEYDSSNNTSSNNTTTTNNNINSSSHSDTKEDDNDNRIAVNGKDRNADIDKNNNSYLNDEAAPANTIIMHKIPLIYGYLPPLTLAIAQGSIDMIQLLLKKGARLDLNLSILMEYASEPEELNIDHILLQAAAGAVNNTSATTSNTTTTTATGAESTSSVPSTATTTAAAAPTPEMLAAEKKLEEYEEAEEQREKLLQEVTLLYTHCSTPLLLAVYLNRLNIVQILLDQHKLQQQQQKQISLQSDNNITTSDSVSNMTANENRTSSHDNNNNSKNSSSSSSSSTDSSSVAADADSFATATTTIITTITKIAKNSNILEQQNSFGITAVELAAHFGYADTVLLLMQYGANFPVRKQYGWLVVRFLCSLMYHMRWLKLFWFFWLLITANNGMKCSDNNSAIHDSSTASTNNTGIFSRLWRSSRKSKID